MLVKLYNNNLNANEIRRITGVLRGGGVIIVPTDTVYAFACDIFHQQAAEFITKLKKHDLRRANLSFVCDSLSQVSQ